ncbi:MAG: restriction endonuclease subunit S [Oscillospiraceae bacterium]|nr:restriction endonuclease subunit S [Oscillospiraceae bacterium]
MARLEDVCEILDSKRVPITAKDRVAGPYPYYGANGVQDYVADYIFDDELVLLAEDGGHFGSTDKPIAYRVKGKCWVNNHAHVLKAKDCIDIDYLCYSLMFRDVSDIVNGATRQKLTQADMRKIEIPLLPIAEQKSVVAKISKVFELIALRKEQLAKLDQLVKSRFIELFGMPGADDFGWGLMPLGSICYINPKKGQDPRLSSGVEVSFVPMPAVTERGEIDATAVKEYDEVKTGFTYFAENDVLFAKITPCMENGKGAVARGLHNGLGFGSTEFHVLRPISGKSNPYWIYTLTAFSQFREDAASNMTGSAGQRRVPASFLENYRVAVPPIERQEQFAAFVEQTDKSKLAIQQSLNKLELLKKSLMQKYFG